MEPGRWIRALREEKMVKPSDVERISRSLASAKNNTDFYVSHSTLADIESGSIPSIHKLFSLSVCFKVPLKELLLSFDIDIDEAGLYDVTSLEENPSPQLPQLREPPFRFQLNFDTNFTAAETTLLRLQPQQVQSLPPFFQARYDPLRFRFAVIGTSDDSMADLLPPRSIVEVDTTQNTVQVFAWRSLRDRPLYLVWHNGGHACRWCQVDGRELSLLPHPLSAQPVLRFKMPSEATVVGRITNAWLPFEPVRFQKEVAS
jgi:transcriptional regulator with XRE-family HTH domain